MYKSWERIFLVQVCIAKQSSFFVTFYGWNFRKSELVMDVVQALGH